jgi:hypothetical protein
MRQWIVAALTGIALGCLLAPLHPALAQGQSYGGTIGSPIAPATMNRPWVTVLFIQGVRIQATVDNLAARMANETLAQASQRKGQALVTAVNNQIAAAIANGTLPANQAMATLAAAPATIQAADRFGNLLYLDRFGRPTPVNTGVPYIINNNLAGYGVVSVPNVTQLGDDPKKPPKNPRDRAQDPTGEIAAGNFKPVINNGGGTGVQGAMLGTGATQGAATGRDATGAASSVSFGVFDAQGQDAACAPTLPPASRCPGDFIATINPVSGENDGQVLGDLASLFNSLFSVDGLTASYDPLTDALFLDQALTPFEMLFTQNTDPGLELDAFLGVPEPATILVLGGGLIMLIAVRGKMPARAAGRPVSSRTAGWRGGS